MNEIKLSEESRKTLKGAVTEMVNSFYLEQAQKDHRKEIAKRMLDELEFPSKTFNKISKTAYADSARKQDQELTEVLDILEELGFYSHDETDNVDEA